MSIEILIQKDETLAKKKTDGHLSILLRLTPL
jgi:hypothetical protein